MEMVVGGARGLRVKEKGYRRGSKEKGVKRCRGSFEEEELKGFRRSLEKEELKGFRRGFKEEIERCQRRVNEFL